MSDVPLTEQRNPASFQIDLKTTEEILRIINAEDKTIPLVIEQSIPSLANLIDCLVECFKAGGRLFYLGAGTSGRLGVLDASECPPTYGVSPDMVQGFIAGGDVALRKSVENAEDDSQQGIEQLQGENFSSKDMLIGITASGSAPYVVGAMQYAQSLGSPVGAIGCNKNSLIFTCCEFPICIPVGPEIVTGSTRMKAGTAQKLVLNMITTTAMIRLGKVYNNYMIDLVPVNAKLIKRSIRLIKEITNCDVEVAENAFYASDKQVRTAIVMVLFALSKDEAKELLDTNDKNINKILATREGGQKDLSGGKV